MSTQPFAVKDIQSNHFRDLHLYPLNDEKVEVLRESIRTTGFWDNVVGRINTKNKPELAYGHHRLEAVKKELGADYIVNLIIRDLNDTQMLQMMARENMEDWGTSFPVVLDTIRVAVKAFAEGEVKFDPVTKVAKSYKRFAPSFISGDLGGPPRSLYTATTLGEFLGWLDTSGYASTRLLNGLNALELIERDCMSEDNFNGLSKEQGYALTKETKKTYGRYVTKAKSANKEAIKAQKEGNARLATSQTKLADRNRADGVKAAQNVADTISDEIQSGTLKGSISARAAKLDKPRKNSKPPDINRVIRELAKGVNTLLVEGDKKLEKFEALSGFFGEADFVDARGLHTALLQLSSRATEMAETINIKEHKGHDGTTTNHSRARDGSSPVLVQGGQ